MKLVTENKRLSFMTLFLATAILAGAHGAKAQDMLDEADDLLSDSDALQMDDINVDGKISASERLRQRREKLEERNKVMVEKKIEDIRVKQEIALTNKLQDAFGKSLNNLNEDKVQTVQAAPVAAQPVQVVETKIVEIPAEPVKVVKSSKVIPSLGTSSLKGDRIDFESNLNLGVNVETMVMPQVSIGLGLGYTTLDITDVSNDFVNYGYGNYNSGYYGTYGTGRKMTLGKLSVEANSKFFFTEDSRVKPYAGAALNFNRSKLKYEDSGAYTSNTGVNFGNEGFSSSTLGAKASLGAEIDFNETIGFNIDLSYAKNLTSGISKTAETAGSINPDQGRLENITKEIEDASSTAIQAGLVVKF